MTDKSTHNNRNFSADDLRDYLAGRLSVADMHALEQAALEDPFLADALDGMRLAQESLPAGKWSEEMNALKKDLANRTRPQRNSGLLLSLRAWRVAAAVLVLTLGGTAAYLAWFRPAPAREVLAVQTPPEADSTLKSEKAAPPSAGVKEEEQMPPRTSSDASEEKLQEHLKPGPARHSLPATETASATRADQPAVSPPPVSVPPPAAAAAHAKPRPKASEEIETVQVEAKAAKAPAQSDSDISSDQFGILKGKTTSDLLTMNQFQGQVINQDNIPIPNAVLSTTDRKTIVRTDDNGRFRISSPDSLLDLRVSSLGYRAASVRLSNHGEASLQLQADSNRLAEVQATGYANRARKEANAMVSENKRNNPRVEPLKGWGAFAQYLADNKRSLPKQEKGTVLLAFEIDQKGSLKNLRVIESLGEQEDEEALRLIEQGPPWKLLKGKRATVTLRINFQ